MSSSILLARFIILLFGFPIHEMAHAWTAYYFGDDTPKNHGRLSFNPLVHLDLFGSLLILVAGFGWAKPVPVNPYILRKHSKYANMLVSLAGPISNLLMALLAAIPIQLGLVKYQGFSSGFTMPNLFEFLFYFILTNILLMVFNLIPLAPLDGEKVLEFFIPDRFLPIFEKFRQYGPIALIIIIFLLPRFGIDIIGSVMNPIISGLLSILVGG
ncbi:MAG: site-2 protease family protein [Chloroflexi bacterium HGW-Chloroflexi-10]|nr:MAG: site-2 protease family protein [Chloroflexi bacterium HGW-Chloroflexi-10]